MGACVSIDTIWVLSRIMRAALVPVLPSAAGSRWSLPRPEVSPALLVVAIAVFFAVAANQAFLSAALAGRTANAFSTWSFAAALLVMLTALHSLLLSLVMFRWATRPLLSLMILAAAGATYYMQKFGIYIDPTMARNVLHTDLVEAGELLTLDLLRHMALYAAPPIFVVWWARLRRQTWQRALLQRLGLMLGSVALLLICLLLVFQDFSSLMRNHKEMRYLITPANAVYSFSRAIAVDTRQVNRKREPVGTDARLAAGWSDRARPALFVVMVGETARAANWGLNGYTRQTTPELAALDVVNFTDVTSCGTNTETSLPCMFSAIGRRDYDEDRIRHSDSLLHVLARAGFEVVWRDNQSGCKGVCAGLTEQRLDRSEVPGLCADGRCLDEILVRGLDSIARDAKGNLVVVLHMLGNHGPSYYKRYDERFKRFVPACETDELRQCSRQQVVNAYDNALLYTDHVIAETIGFLKTQSGKFDTGLIYVSDHGESLGEKGLFLHGIPYAIAPDEQTRVPMVWWLSPSFKKSFGIDGECLLRTTGKPVSHDHLFHSVLGLLQVQTSAYEKAFDAAASCRG